MLKLRINQFIHLVFITLFYSCSLKLDEKHFIRAEEFLRQGQFKKSIDEYSRVVNYSKNNQLAIQAHLQMGSIFENSIKDYSQAIQAYREVVKKSNDKSLQVKSLIKIAQIYSDKLEKPKIASEEYLRILETFGKEIKEGPEILLSLAKSYLDSTEFTKSAEIYEEFRKTFINHQEVPRTIYYQGQAYLSDKQYEKAIQSFKEVIVRYMGNANYNDLVGEAFFGLSSAYEADQKLEEAISALRSALPLYPNQKVIELKIQRLEKRKKEKAF